MDTIRLIDEVDERSRKEALDKKLSYQKAQQQQRHTKIRDNSEGKLDLNEVLCEECPLCGDSVIEAI